jgi:hypothetical protein
MTLPSPLILVRPGGKYGPQPTISQNTSIELTENEKERKEDLQRASEVILSSLNREGPGERENGGFQSLLSSQLWTELLD